MRAPNLIRSLEYPLGLALVMFPRTESESRGDEDTGEDRDAVEKCEVPEVADGRGDPDWVLIAEEAPIHEAGPRQSVYEEIGRASCRERVFVCV